MIRSFTCVCALLAGASGLYLYSEKHRTTLLDQQISKIVSDTQQIRERTAMLRAEWALLNQPDRLQGLATRFLPQLGPMAPTQFVQLATLDSRLPAVGPETPPHPIVTPETAPSLVGARPAAPAATGSPDAGDAAIADATPPARPGSRPGANQATVLAQSSAPAHAAKAGAPHRVPADLQIADATDGGEDAGGTPGAHGTQDVVPQAAMRRVVAHAAPHAAHAAPPVRLAAAAVPRPQGASAPLVTRIASTYRAPPVIAAAAWRTARAAAQPAWPAPRAVGYAVPSAPAGMPVGSSLGSGRSSLPAPVPVADGN